MDEETDKCTFCGNPGANTFFKKKGMCENCFREIFEWAQHGEINRRMEKIQKEIYKVLTRYDKKKIK